MLADDKQANSRRRAAARHGCATRDWRSNSVQTGNDLSRELQWGKGYEGTPLAKILKHVQFDSARIKMDRWSGACIAPRRAA